MVKQEQVPGTSFPQTWGAGGASPQVCALVPAYNEAERIGATLGALRACRAIGKVIVADDGSRDETVRRAQDAGAHSVVAVPHGGKGNALAAAYKEDGGWADIYLLLDADLGASAAECVKLLAPVAAGDADMTIGMLPPDPAFAATGQRGGMGAVVKLARRGIERQTGAVLAQPLSGQRAVRRAVLEAVDGQFAAGFGVEVALTLAALRAGFVVREVPAAFRHRVTGSDWRGLLHRARQWRDVARVVWR